VYRNYYMQKRGCCSCNNMCNNEEKQEIIEDTCMYAKNIEQSNDSCECGFDEKNNVFPDNPMLAQSYVPWQTMDKTFVPSVGLKMGTIFPELVSPYMPGDSMKQIEYLKKSNKMGEGCNK